jgi:hypothetical protein
VRKRIASKQMWKFCRTTEMDFQRNQLPTACKPHKFRLVKIRGELAAEEMRKINEALKIVFAL